MSSYPFQCRDGCSWLAALRPAGGTELSQAMVSPVLLDQVVAATGPGAAGWAVETSRRLCDGTIEEWLSARPGRRAERLLVETVSLWAILWLSGTRVLPPMLENELEATVRGNVELGISSDVLLRGVRRVHAELVQELFRFCDSVLPVAECPAVMQGISAELFDGMEVLVSFIAGAFATQQARWRGGAEQRRVARVSAILDGRPTDIGKATRQLGYDLTLHHIALVAWRDEFGADSASELKRSALRILEAAGCSSTLLLPVAPDRLWAWGGCASGPPTELNRLADLPLTAPHVHVASGLPGDGIAGFRRSHDQAVAAAGLRTVAEPPLAGLCDYRALEVVLLLRGDDFGAVTDFVARELGPLAAGDKHMAVLRETVLCYLEQERSVAATANLLYVARNTVVYRVKKAEDLLGRSLREFGADRLRLHLALYLAGKLGSAVLPGGRNEPGRLRPVAG